MLKAGSRSISAIFGLSMLLATGALMTSPLDAQGGCKIKCEKCTVNLNTGEAECTDCTITGCDVSVE